MYILINSLKNLHRYRRRYMITLTGLVGILGLCFYGMAYYPIIRDYDAAVKYVDESENFNADGSMSRYDYNLTVNRVYFEQFTASPYISEMNLAYGCRVYAEMRSNHGEDPARKGLVLYGGSADTLNLYLNEIMYRDFPRELEIVEGREPHPEAAECMLYRDMAECNGLEIGDSLLLYDESGEELTELKIVGLVICYINYGTHRAEEDVNTLGYRIGSMPYRRLKTTLLYHIFTDFDTAYGIYGDETDPEFAENHTFNNYIPIYRLTSSKEYGDFERKLAEYTYDSNLHFYQMNSAGTPYLREYDEKAAVLTVMIAGGLSIAAVTLMIGILLYERREETKILCALGIGKRKIFFGWMLEISIFITILWGFSILLAANADRIFDWFDAFYFDRLFEFQITAESAGMIILFTAALVCTALIVSLIYLRNITGSERT